MLPWDHHRKTAYLMMKVKSQLPFPYSVSGAATLPQTAPSRAELSRDSLPVFGAQPVLHAPQLISLIRITITVVSDVP